MAQQSPPRASQQKPAQRTYNQPALTPEGFQNQIGKYESMIQKVMPPGVTFGAQRMLTLAYTALMRTPDLKLCTPLSIVNSLALAASLGLEVNTPLGHAYLIPYKHTTKEGREYYLCQFQPGYRGLIHLALHNPRVHSVDAHVVYDADLFKLSYGTAGSLVHVPNIDARNRGQQGVYVGAYALLRYRERDIPDPDYHFMTRAEIEAVKAVAVKAGSGPWSVPAYVDEMIRKTPMKRFLKYKPLTPAVERAVGLDDQAEIGAAQEVMLDLAPDQWGEVGPTEDPQRIESQAGSSAPGGGVHTGNAGNGGSTAQTRPSNEAQKQEAPPPQQNQPDRTDREPPNGGTLRRDHFDAEELQQLQYSLRRVGIARNAAQVDAWLAQRPPNSTRRQALDHAEGLLLDLEQKEAQEKQQSAAPEVDDGTRGLFREGM